ncbi:alpha/beta fold hydrolase [Streptomyces griseomycini]|uniref:Pimeloyl-ACP methyl ester carboxylesterase n=1 Tax=Streptomyces griseomycini TaxID=66895 RepID=A0A7W7VAA6_9ACTN|nr:alpha/beta hydrolase [Streptomyces griseomycini]MBB4902923.1 pimeloyl-ACP methyl ester carboxylesterase [Streptomyces griseomycini]GGQ31496.1 alpha/beta hydrolase [Streptomyces griseomycini]GGR47823.1 alpha/beta hydrolase [Streptomyces griseomycini]
MDKNILSRDGTSLGYESAGRGSAVVLVSGAMSTGATVAPLAAPLSERFRVAVYDRRGRGASGDTAPYAVEREVEDLAAVIGAMGGEASLYGVSSGGALALRAAASGLPVRHVAVYETPYAMSGDALRERAQYTERLTAALAEGRRGDAVELFLRLTGLDEAVIQGARQSPLWAGMESLAPSLAYDDAVMGDGSVPRELLSSIRVPVLAIAGDGSPAWMREAARAVADAVPRGAYRVLEGQTHMADPEVLAPVLAEFFAR